MSELLFQGKTAIVTGGTSGIGRKIVELFRRHGADVLFTGRDATRAEEVSVSTGATFFAANAARPDHARLVLDKALSLYDRVDILVNNAGGLGAVGGVEDISTEVLDDAISIHLRAPWMLIAQVAPVMRARGGGSIVNICSVAGQRIGAASLAYSVAKAAMIHLSRSAAAELGKDNIRVNSVSPGFIATPIHTSHLDLEEARKARVAAGLARLYISRQALRQTGQPGDVADVVLFLASERSKFMTGADVVVDGGMIWGQPVETERWSK